MSYANQRNVNVSRYLRNLNVQEPVVEETFITDDDLAKDLALFTNTQFFDFETGQNTDYQAPPVKPETVTQSSPVDDVTSADPLLADFSTNIDFIPSEFSRSFFELLKQVFSFLAMRPLYTNFFCTLLSFARGKTISGGVKSKSSLMADP